MIQQASAHSVTLLPLLEGMKVKGGGEGAGTGASACTQARIGKLGNRVTSRSRPALDPWATSVAAWLLAASTIETPVTTLTASEVWTQVLGQDEFPLDRIARQRISAVMRRLGWWRCSVSRHGSSGRCVVKGYRRENPFIAAMLRERRRAQP